MFPVSKKIKGYPWYYRFLSDINMFLYRLGNGVFNKFQLSGNKIQEERGVNSKGMYMQK